MLSLKKSQSRPWRLITDGAGLRIILARGEGIGHMSGDDCCALIFFMGFNVGTPTCAFHDIAVMIMESRLFVENALVAELYCALVDFVTQRFVQNVSKFHHCI